MYSRDPSSQVCFNSPHDDIAKIEGFHFHHGKAKVDDITCVAFVHHARHRFLEGQQTGEAGPTV